MAMGQPQTTEQMAVLVEEELTQAAHLARQAQEDPMVQMDVETLRDRAIWETTFAYLNTTR